MAVLLAVPLAAQETLDQRYQRAYDAFNSGRMEESCELFQQIVREKPDFKEAAKYSKWACDQTKLLYDTEEKAYTEGVRLLNQGQLEQAKEKLTQAANVKGIKNPKYRAESNRLLKEIETRESEEKAFADGVRLFEQGQLEPAKRRFEGISGPKAADAKSYLQRIEQQGAAQREETAFSGAVELFNRGDLAAARVAFDQVAKMNGKRRAEAEDYLSRIDRSLNARREEDTAFQDGVNKFDRKDYQGARTAFQRVVAMNSSRKADAQGYLDRITAAEKAAREAEVATRADETPQQAVARLLGEARAAMGQRDYKTALEKLQVAEVLDPRNSELQRLLSQAKEQQAEQALRAGLQAYFEGRWDEAERNLSQYLEGNGRKRGLALFFRGATRSTRYFLSGEKDAQQKELAQADFRAVGEASRNFRAPERYISPKILDLYKASNP